MCIESNQKEESISIQRGFVDNYIGVRTKVDTPSAGGVYLSEVHILLLFLSS